MNHLIFHKKFKSFEKLNDEKGIADIKYTLGGFYYKTTDFQMGVVCLIDALVIYKNTMTIITFQNVKKH